MTPDFAMSTENCALSPEHYVIIHSNAREETTASIFYV